MATNLEDNDIFSTSNSDLFSAVFKDAVSENWENNPDFTQYFTELTSSSLDRLNAEPKRLVEERTQLLEQTQELAFNNYKTFIKTADCSREIFEDFIRVENQVDSLLDTLPSFIEKCRQFQEFGQEINSRRRSNSIVLSRHTQLLEALEIPQLMDTCVRNSYYEEALELATFVKRLEKRFSTITVVQSIIKDVQASSQLMLVQLLQQLRTNVQLPQCLRIIGYLRRLDVFSETELRMKFLQARDTWFASVLSTIPKEDAYHHISKTIEASRVHLFDIITQYRAIFSDDDPGLLTDDDESASHSGLFHAWIVQKISGFLSTLHDDLSKGVGGRLDSLVGQCMYFGLSFSRVGSDFRGLLAPLFQDAALKSFSTSLEAATRSFKQAINGHHLVTMPPALTSTIMASNTTKVQSDNLAPPLILLEHPVMASFTNAILTAFNDLRLCAPLGIAHSVKTKLESTLQAVVSETMAYYRTEVGALNDEEKEVFVKFSTVLVKELLPYLNKCLKTLFQPEEIELLPGVKSQLSTTVITLNIEELTKPLLSILSDEIMENTLVSVNVDTPSSNHHEHDMDINVQSTLDEVPDLSPEKPIMVSEINHDRDIIHTEKPVIKTREISSDSNIGTDRVKKQVSVTS